MHSARGFLAVTTAFWAMACGVADAQKGSPTPPTTTTPTTVTVTPSPVSGGPTKPPASATPSPARPATLGAALCLPGLPCLPDIPGLPDLPTPPPLPPIGLPPLPGPLAGIQVPFVTVHDPDGDGPQPSAAPRTVTVTVQLPMFVDVDGTTPAGLVPLPGHDLTLLVTLPTLDADRPRITVSRAPLAAAGPIRASVEAVVDAGSHPGFKRTFGYDARATGAPQSFNADLDLSNAGAPAGATRTRVNLALAAPTSRLTVLSEEYQPGADGARTERSRNRLAFDGEDAGTQVPTQVAVDLHQAGDDLDIALSHDRQTRAQLLVSGPDDSTVTEASLDRLPAAVRLHQATGATPGSARTTFEASAPTARATISRTQRLGTTPAHTRRVVSEIRDLPTRLRLETGGDLAYVDLDAASRIPSLTVGVSDERPLFARARHLEVALTDVPTLLEVDLDGGDVAVLARTVPESAPLGQAAVRISDTVPAALPACAAPCADRVAVEITPARYALDLRISRLFAASYRRGGDPDGTGRTTAVLADVAAPDTERVCDPDGCRDHEVAPALPLEVALRLQPSVTSRLLSLDARLSALGPQTRFEQIERDGDQRFRIGHTHRTRPSLTLDVTGLPDISTGTNGVAADEVHASLLGLPPVLDLVAADDGDIDLQASGPGSTAWTLSKLDVLVTSGDTTRLPLQDCVSMAGHAQPCQHNRLINGILTRDDATRNLAHVRLWGVKRLVLDDEAGDQASSTKLEVDAEADGSTFKIDRQKRVPGPGTITGTEEDVIAVEDTPGRFTMISRSAKPGRTEFDWKAARATTRFTRYVQTVYAGDASSGNSTMRISPLPARLDICSGTKRDDDGLQPCDRNVFDVDPSEDGTSIGVHADQPLRFERFENPPGPHWTAMHLNIGGNFTMHFDEIPTLSRLGIDTGWDGTGVPPASAQVSGRIEQQSPREGNIITLPAGFAASRRIMWWKSEALLALNSFESTSGKVLCPPGTSILARRPKVGFEIEVEIGDSFCGRRPTADEKTASPERSR